MYFCVYRQTTERISNKLKMNYIKNLNVQKYREESIRESSRRKRLPVESIRTCSYHMMEFGKVAYPMIEVAHQSTTAKDYLVGG